MTWYQIRESDADTRLNRLIEKNGTIIEQNTVQLKNTSELVAAARVEIQQNTQLIYKTSELVKNTEDQISKLTMQISILNSQVKLLSEMNNRSAGEVAIRDSLKKYQLINQCIDLGEKLVETRQGGSRDSSSEGVYLSTLPIIEDITLILSNSQMLIHDTLRISLQKDLNSIHDFSRWCRRLNVIDPKVQPLAFEKWMNLLSHVQFICVQILKEENIPKDRYWFFESF